LKGGQLKILSADQIYDIHMATLDILQHTGVLVHENTALKLLRDAGAGVDEKKELVRIPPHLIEEATRKAPRQFTLYARDPKYNVKIEDRRVYFEPMIGRKNILDAETGVRRSTTLQDVANLVRLADAMENYMILHSGAMMPHIEGVPDQVAHVHGYLTSLRNADKIVKGTGRGKTKAQDCIRMAAVLAGGEEELRKKPNLFTTCNPISPLQHARDQTEGIIEYARHRLPVDITAEVQAGASSPVTLAGSLAVQNAEVLSGVLIAQLASPGAPVFYGTCGTIMDLRSGMIALGAVEAGLINAASAQMAQYYGIPCRGTGGATEAKTLDIQAGYEKAITLLMAALAGANCIFYPGVLESALTISLESLYIDNEICGMVYRALRGIQVDDCTLATDVVEKVGAGGSFLGQRHTLEHLREEEYIPLLNDRESREIWESRGKRDLREVAKERVREVLKKHQPKPLEPSVEEELTRIVKEVEKRELG
jgi:trimethylamine--corrinoid protein Co-methyltransferase